MQVVILAGGLATRLRPITETIPKSMVLINNKPFLEYQIRFLKKAGIFNIILCVGHLSEKIEGYFGDGSKFGVSILYSKDGDTLLGTGGAIKKAESLVWDEFFVIYGDSYLFLDFESVYSLFKKSEKQALMVVYRNQNQFDISNVLVLNGMVSKYDKKNILGDLDYIDYGILLFRKKVLDLIPINHVYPLEMVLQQLIAQNELSAYEAKKRFYEVGSHKGMEEFSQYILNNYK